MWIVFVASLALAVHLGLERRRARRLRFQSWLRSEEGQAAWCRLAAGGRARWR